MGKALWFLCKNLWIVLYTCLPSFLFGLNALIMESNVFKSLKVFYSYIGCTPGHYITTNAQNTSLYFPSLNVKEYHHYITLTCTSISELCIYDLVWFLCSLFKYSKSSCHGGTEVPPFCMSWRDWYCESPIRPNGKPDMIACLGKNSVCYLFFFTVEFIFCKTMDTY